MTTPPSIGSARIGQLRDEFLRSEAGRKLTAEESSRLRKFVTWCGVSTSVEAVPPFKVEEFLASQLNTSTPPRSYMSALKAFFSFAHQEGALAANPMTAVRLPRGAGAAPRRVAPGQSAAAAAAQAARLSAQREADLVYVSKGQHEAMQSELDRLRNEERHRVSQMLHDAIKDGDLSENAAYDDAKMRQGLLEAKIRELEAKLRHVALIEDQDRSGGGVGVGSTVTLKEIESGDEINYQVVGPEETDPRKGRISHLSPVGRALMGKSAGEDVVVTTPGGSVRYTIVSVA
jgi:transcription elongation factor GreA